MGSAMVMIAPCLQAAMSYGTVRSVVKTDPRTGRLVRIVIGPPGSRVHKVDPAMKTLAEQTARDMKIDPALVQSVIEVESNYDPYAVSNKGAQGLMQLMPATAKRFGVKNSFDPKENIEAGVQYLKFLQNKFQDERLAIAAYNAGEGAVMKYNGVPPYRETRSYLEKVDRKLKAKSATVIAQARVPDAGPEASTAAEEQHPKLAQFVDAQGRLHITTQ
ncbi:MAG TPA: lytic transglycosylase domain-containing protein [Bryobacteraceae bacterium]|nr:lytic transglycosylase domain-containing protein [Bryobacteraceae bacterium]